MRRRFGLIWAMRPRCRVRILIRRFVSLRFSVMSRLIVTVWWMISGGRLIVLRYWRFWGRLGRTWWVRLILRIVWLCARRVLILLGDRMRCRCRLRLSLFCRLFGRVSLLLKVLRMRRGRRVMGIRKVRRRGRWYGLLFWVWLRVTRLFPMMRLNRLLFSVRLFGVMRFVVLCMRLRICRFLLSRWLNVLGVSLVSR